MTGPLSICKWSIFYFGDIYELRDIVKNEDVWPFPFFVFWLQAFASNV
jgi:hypothetical protein